MSDYLWDKSGEADPEVERLEQLLGGLRHRPAALELPRATPKRTTYGASRFLRTAALAAAALALVALSGLLIALLAPDAGEHVATDTREASRTGEGRMQAADAAGVAAPRAGVVEETNETTGRQYAPVQTAGVRRGSSGARPVARRSRDAARRVRGARPSVSAEVAAWHTARTLDAGNEADRAEAKEQLLYALRLASVKLGDARRMAHGDDDN